MECKGTLQDKLDTQDQLVLIETLWNVKYLRFALKASMLRVLIEKLWNVKIGNLTSQMFANLCFNRNIVECKGLTEEEKYNREQVLIETLWNVKKTGWTESPTDEQVLIETLWNVKEELEFTTVNMAGF